MAVDALAIERHASLAGVADDDLDEIVAATRPLADDLRGARVLVTGASGWFGTWLLDGLVAVDRAQALELRVVALCRWPALFAARHPALYAAPQIAWVAGDVRDDGLAIDGPLTHVIHAATASGGVAAQSDLLFDTIVAGTRNVFDCARRQRARRFLFISSGAVYGPQPTGAAPLAESSFDAASTAGDAYARGKRRAETALLRSAHDDAPGVSIARCFAFVGPHMPLDAHFAIGNFIGDAVGGRPVRVTGDGTPRRSYLYTSDLVAWLLTMLVRGAPGRAYNVGSPHAVTIRDLAGRCAAIPRAAVPVIVAGEAGRRDYVPDVARATDELGLRVRVPLDDAIARTADWARRRRT